MGAQLAVDITLRSALTCCGAPRPNAAAVDGAVLTQARRDKDRYSELVAAQRCRLVVVALETGGWWSGEASFIEERSRPGRETHRSACADPHILGVEEAVDQNVFGRSDT